MGQMKQLSKHISLALKELRKKKGWSLDMAASKTGVSKAMLGQIERGGIEPDYRYSMENSQRL